MYDIEKSALYYMSRSVTAQLHSVAEIGVTVLGVPYIEMGALWDSQGIAHISFFSFHTIHFFWCGTTYLSL